MTASRIKTPSGDKARRVHRTVSKGWDALGTDGGVVDFPPQMAGRRDVQGIHNAQVPWCGVYGEK